MHAMTRAKREIQGHQSTERMPNDVGLIPTHGIQHGPSVVRHAINGHGTPRGHASAQASVIKRKTSAMGRQLIRLGTPPTSMHPDTLDEKHPPALTGYVVGKTTSFGFGHTFHATTFVKNPKRPSLATHNNSHCSPRRRGMSFFLDRRARKRCRADFRDVPIIVIVYHQRRVLSPSRTPHFLGKDRAMSRYDLEIYNESTGFMITSKGLCGQDFSGIEAEDKAWKTAIREGVFLPFELVQDDSFIIRVVVDEPLSEQERDEWVGMTTHKLRIPDGDLAVIGGGLEFLWGEDMEEFARFQKVPPGDYLAEVYTYLQGVNGEYCLDLAKPREPLGAYFRRTRPGEPFPLWLKNECASDPDIDPDHKKEWENAEADYDTEQPPYVSFLLRLSPLLEAPPLPKFEEGWITVGQNPRRPEKCPLGLIAEYLEESGDG